MNQEHAQLIASLGFESIDSLARALRTDGEKLNGTVELCRKGYPYVSWKEPKKSGKGFRLIENPSQPLKLVQTRANRLLQRVFDPFVFHGCVAQTSIRTNAEPHCQNSWFLGLDLADYYATIRPSKVYEGLLSLGATPDIAHLLTTITTIHHHVPQGAPTSPVVAAIAMRRLAGRLADLVAEFDGVLTIFGDNISISAGRDLRRYQNTIIRIIRMEGFRIRKEKTAICLPGAGKPLPGLVIKNQKIQVRPEDKEAVELIIRQCESLKASGLRSKVCWRFKHRLRGMVNHFAWLDGKTMAPFKDRFKEVDWPDSHERQVCRLRSCYCLPLPRFQQSVDA